MKFFNILILIFMIFSSFVFAHDREATIRLGGKVKEGISKRVTIKEIESNLKIFQENIYNPYEKHTDLYGGVLFNDFVKKYALDDVKEVKLIALDDYTISIYKDEWESMRIILATRLHKKYIPIKLKGPLMSVFPDYDAKKKEYQESISKWIWMIKKIEFK